MWGLDGDATLHGFLAISDTSRESEHDSLKSQTLDNQQQRGYHPQTSADGSRKSPQFIPVKKEPFTVLRMYMHCTGKCTLQRQGWQTNLGTKVMDPHFDVLV